MRRLGVRFAASRDGLQDLAGLFSSVRFWHETFLPSGTPRPVPGCAKAERRLRASPVLARRRSRCGGLGLRQAGCVAACPAAGCSMPQFFILRIRRGAFLRATISRQSVPGSVQAPGSSGPHGSRGPACGRWRRKPACSSSSPWGRGSGCGTGSPWFGRRRARIRRGPSGAPDCPSGRVRSAAGLRSRCCPDRARPERRSARARRTCRCRGRTLPAEFGRLCDRHRAGRPGPISGSDLWRSAFAGLHACSHRAAFTAGRAAKPARDQRLSGCDGI